MILAVDVHYKTNYAKTVVLLFENWSSQTYSECIEVRTTEVAAYVPGEFYKRELPCIVEAFKKINWAIIEVVIVDGYIYVGDDLTPGLGGHLYQSLGQKVPVIGVAKSSFANNKNTVVAVFRGESKKPLYVSAIGTTIEHAAQSISAMYGDYRLPHLLKVMDQKTKED